MRLIAFRNDAGAPAPGARVGDELVDLAAIGLPASLDELLRLETPRSTRPEPGTRGKNGRLRSPLPESPLSTLPNLLNAERILNL